MSRKFTILVSFLLLFICSGNLFAQTSNTQIPPPADSAGKVDYKIYKPILHPYPFNFSTIDGRFDLYLDLTDSSIIKKFKPIFARHKISFTGDSWDEIIRQTLDLYNAPVAKNLATIPEEDGLSIGTNNRMFQEPFLNEMVPLFNDLAKFEQLLDEIDKSRIP